MERSVCRKKLVVVGASGFIGTAVCRDLARDHDVTMLTRSRALARRNDPDLPVRRQHCDLFSPEEIERALVGFDLAVYLVNNMLPSSRLSQAQCRDMDVLIADNFGRSAARAGIKQIVYLGLLLPQGDVPADLVASRQEVSRALGAHGTPVTTVRAGLIVGPGSNLVRLVANLATRPPLILLPSWANGRKQPVALRDVVRAIRRCLGETARYGKSYDLGGPQVLRVREILQAASQELGRRRPVIMVPFLPAFLYRAWIRLLDRDVHPALIQRALAALPHDTVARDNDLQRELVPEAVLAPEDSRPAPERGPQDLLTSPRSTHRRVDDSDLYMERRVRSIQRLSLPAGRDAEWVAKHYFRWLPGIALRLIRCHKEGGLVRITSRLPQLDLLRLQCLPEHSTTGWRLYSIQGGVLARVVGPSTARLEFRQVRDEPFVIFAIHDFRPALPWSLYVLTQAVIHLGVMKAFQKHMRRLAARSEPPGGDR